MATEQEIEATLARSKEIDEQIAQLLKQAKERNLNELFDSADNQFARFAGVLAAQNPPAGTGPACFDATVELIADWAGMEVAAIEGMDEADGGSSAKPKSAPSRPAQRRGMRI
jgi:hypothetical protein